MSGINYINVEEVSGNSLDRLNSLLAGFEKGQGAIKAAYAALKRASAKTKTEAGRFAAAQYTISKGTFMKNVTMKTKVDGGSGGVTSLSISYAGSVLPLLTFNTRYSRGGGMETQVKRTGGAEVLQHVFTAKMHGPIAAYERIGKPRFPVEAKFGPSTGHMMRNDIVVEQMDEMVRNTFEERIDHEIWRVMAGLGGK